MHVFLRRMRGGGDQQIEIFGVEPAGEGDGRDLSGGGSVECGMSLENDGKLFLIAHGSEYGLPLAEVGGTDLEVQSRVRGERATGVHLSGAGGRAEFFNLEFAGGCAVLRLSVGIQGQLSGAKVGRGRYIQRNRGFGVSRRAPPLRIHSSASGTRQI